MMRLITILVIAGIFSVGFADAAEHSALSNIFTLETRQPVANFSANSTSVDVQQSVTFTDLSQNNPTSWSWNFGDGGTSSAQNPTHPYSAPGYYTVTLTVTNPAGTDTESKGNYIHVEDNTDITPPPSPVISSSTHTENAWSDNDDPRFTWTEPTDISGINGYSYVLDNSSSTIPDTTSEGSSTSENYYNKVDGTWYFHVRAMDGAGNWGSTDHYCVKIDEQEPDTTIILSPASPDGSNGWYVSTVRITLSASDGLSGISSTKYRLDGNSWRNYSSSLTLSDCEHIIEYYSIDNAGNQEDGKSKTINIDTVPPETALTLSGTEGDNGWYVTPVQITLSSADTCSKVADIKYRIDNGSWWNYASPFNLPDCEQTIEYYSEDKAGNTEGMKTQNVKIDTIAPSANLTLNGTAGENDWYKSDVIVDIDSSDSCSSVKSERIKIDSGSEQTPSVTVRSEGIHTIEYYAVDNAGNESSSASNRDDASVKIDKTPPSAPQASSSTHEQDIWSNNGSVEVCWTEPSDISRIAGYSYVLDGNPSTIPDESIQTTMKCVTTNPGGGIWYFHVRAKDNAGWWGNTGHYGPIKIDTQKPVTTISLTPEVPDGKNGWYSSSVQVTLSSTDSLSSVSSTKYRLDSGNWQNYSSSFMLSDCDHTIEYYSVDYAGNEETAKSEDVRIDTVKPETDIVVSGTVGDNGWYTTPVQVALSPTDDCSELASTQYRIDGDNWQTYSSPFTLSDCRHIIEYYSIDSAGNTEDMKSQEVKVDTVVPEVSSTLSGTEGKNGWYASDVIVGIENLDSCSGVCSEYVKIDDGPEQTPPVTIKTEGTHTVIYYARDCAGNESSGSSSARIDKAPPSAPEISSSTHEPGLCSNNTSIEFFWIVSADTSGIEGYSYELDRNPIIIPDDIVDGVDTSTSYSNQDDADDWYFHVRAKDNAGHWGETGHFGPIGIDTGMPTTTISLNPEFPDGENGWYVTQVKVTLSAEDSLCGVASTKYRINNANWQEYSSPFTLSDCDRVIEYYSVDRAGNQENVKSRDVKMDTTPPETTIALSGTEGDNGWYTTPVQITLSATDSCSEVLSTKYRIDGNSWQDYSAPFTLSDCKYTFEYYSVDNAGNQESVKSETIKIDAVPPETNIILSGTEGDNGWYNSLVEVILSAVDSCPEVISTKYRIDGDSWQDYTESFTISDCEHTIEYYSMDNAGNKEDIKSETIKIDTEPPETIIHFSVTEGDDEWSKNPVQVTLSTVDSCSGVASIKYRIDSGNWEDYSTSFILSDCEHGVEYYSVDNAGNEEDIKTGSLKIDTVAPKTIISLSGVAGNDEWFISSVEITLLALDDCSGISSIEYRRDNGEWQSYIGPFTVSDCERMVEYYSKDNAGNAEDIKRQEIKVDATAPEASLILDGDEGENGWYVSDVTVDVESADDCSGVCSEYVKIDDDSAQAPSTEVNSEGLHAVKYYARDCAGNESKNEIASVGIDRTPPSAPEVSSSTHIPGEWRNNNAPEFSWTGPADTSGIAGYSYELDRNLSTIPDEVVDGVDTATGYADLDSANNWYFHIRAKDNAGHWGDTEHFGPIKIDTQLPTASISISGDKGENDWYISHTVTIDCNASDPMPASGIKECLVKVDDKPWQSVPVNITDEGIHTVSFYAVDNAGNESEKKESEIRLDNIPPVLSNLMHTPESLCRSMEGELEVQVTVSDAVSRVAGMPTLVYEITGGYVGGEVNGSNAGGDSWQFGIPGEWERLGGETLTYTIQVSDDAGNPAESEERQVIIGQQEISTPGTVSFGDVEINNSVDRELIITNTGCAPLEVTSVTTEVGDITIHETNLTIQPGSAESILLTWQPSSAYNLGGSTVIIKSNDPNTPTTVALEGDILKTKSQLFCAVVEDSVTYRCSNVRVNIKLDIDSLELARKETLKVTYTRPSERATKQDAQPIMSGSNTHTAELPADMVDETGDWTVSVYWDGNDVCNPADGDTAFQVTKLPTKIQWNVDSSILIDEPVILTGKIVPDTACSGNFPELDGKSVALRLKDPNMITVGEFTQTIQTETGGVFRTQKEYPFRLEGVWTLEASWAGDDIFHGCDGSMPINVYIEPPKAIIALGGDRNSRDIGDFNTIADKVHNTLLRRNFRDAEDIYYLNPDANRPGADAATSKGKLGEAITNWAAEHVGPRTSLLIYLLSHNTEDNFLLESPGSSNPYLTPAELDGWISDLENKLLGSGRLSPENPTSITAIMDACGSGSFLQPLSRTVRNAENRIVIQRTIITSTSVGEYAYMKPGNCFSTAFFDYVNLDYDTRIAFDNSRSILNAFSSQRPLLDSDGNGDPNKPADYQNVEGVKFGTKSLAEPPQIESVSYEPSTLHKGDSALVSVTLTGAKIESVTGVLVPPSYDKNQEFVDWSELGKGLIDVTFGKIDDQHYEATVDEFSEAGIYFLIVSAENPDGSAPAYRIEIPVDPVAVEPGDKQATTWGMVRNTKLYQNYPNPFNPETWIPYQLSGDAYVKLRIRNITGQLIRTLNLGHKSAGLYIDKAKAIHWDGNNEAGEPVANGTYFYTIQAGDYTATRKMIVAR